MQAKATGTTGSMRTQMKTALVMCGVFAAAALAAVPAAAVAVDSFDTAQANGVPFVSSGGGDILTGERDVRVTTVSGGGSVAASGNGSDFVFSSDPGTQGAVEVQWDGADGDATNLRTTGPAFDLTDGGTSNALQIGVPIVTAPAVLVFEVFSDGGNSSVRSVALPAITPPGYTIALKYASFASNRGSGADFTSVRAVRMFLRGAGTFVALQHVLTGNASSHVLAEKTESHGPAKQGDTLDYTVTVKGRQDAENVTFQDTLDSNAPFVPGSVHVSPIAVEDYYSSSSGSFSTGAPGALQNDRDPDNHLPLAVVVASSDTTSSLGGTVSINADGSFSYTPGPAPLGIPDTFVYTLDDNDADGLTDTTIVTITLTDSASPSVTATTPTSGGTQQSSGTNITIDFSEPVNVTGSAFTVECPVGSPVAFTNVTGGGPAMSFVLDPTSDLPAATLCTVTVVAAQVTDADTNDPPDNMDADYVFSFATDGGPSVSATTPTNGATDQAANVNVTVTFDEAVNVTGNWFDIVCGTSGTHDTGNSLVSGGPLTFTINPSSELAEGESCTATIYAAGVTDQDGNDPPDNMAADYVFGFSVDEAPEVATTTPTNGALGVDTTADIVVDFSESVNAATSSFTIECPTGSGAITYALSASPATSFTLNPDTDLPGNETCTVTVVANQVSDADANDPPNNMTANYVFSFTTDNAPTVVSTTPTSGATDQPIDTNITIDFSENVNVTGAAFSVECPVGSPIAFTNTTGTGPASSFVLDPNADLPAGVACTVTVVASEVTDDDSFDPPDNMAADYVFSFSTDAAPSVTATTPVNGATDQAANASIDVTFSEAVTTAGGSYTVSCTVSGAHTFSSSGGPTTWTLDPDIDFTSGETCTVTVLAAGVADNDANDPPDNMAANFVFSFSIDNAPSVTATAPTNGATQVATNANIDVTFSEPVDMTASGLTISCATSGAHTYTTSGGPTTFTVNPDTDFATDDTCTVTVLAAEVTDQDANDPPDNMLADHVFSFTTDLDPSVSATTPTNGAANALASQDITVTFTEPVNVTGSWFTINCTTSGAHTAVVTGGPTTYTLNPDVDFAFDESCTTTIVAAQVTDQDAGDPPDTMGADYVFSFSIDAPPSVTATTPTNGAVDQTSNTNVSVTFNEAVNAAGGSFTISCAVSGAHTFALGGGPTTWTLNPDVDFAGGELCTVTVLAAGITDQDANDPPDNMAANYVFSFTIDAAPAVDTTTPADAATDVPTDTMIGVTFTEAVTFTHPILTLECPVGSPQAFTVFNSAPTGITFDPTALLPAGTTCTATILATQVADQDIFDPPNTMTANHVFTFTTDAAPAVTTTVPVDTATQVAANTNITINFSEDVNVGLSSFTVECPVGSPVAFGLSGTGPASSFVLDPTADLPFGVTCTVTVVAANVTDSDLNDPPNTMAANFVFSFTVDQAPSVLSTVPTNGAINVLQGANIDLTFSEAVNVSQSTFTIECPAPGSAQSYAITGSGTSTVTLNPNVNLPAGVLCTVTVFANQVSDTDAGDPPDNMVANYVFSFGVKPLAVDDARGATGNVSINTDVTGFNTLSNDVGPGIAVTAVVGGATVRGGTYSIDADGTFAYNPPVGYAGADSFDYTISNANGDDVGTVVLTTTDMVWFVKNDAAACTTFPAGHCGRLTNPFSTLAALEAENGNSDDLNNAVVINPNAGDHIFIYTGAGSYTGPLTLENTQRVIGQGAQSTLASLSGITFAIDSVGLPSTVGTKPSITSGANGFNLATDNRLYGLQFSNTAGTAIAKGGPALAGTVMMADIAISNTASNGAGIVITTGGTVTATGVNTINTRSGTGLNLSGGATIGAANLTFQSISVGNNDGNPDPVNGILLNNTGASGGLIVTGNSSGLCGGQVTVNPVGTLATITTPVVGDCTGGTIQGATGAGISLINTRNVSLTRMNIKNNGSSGIFGDDLTNFSLISSWVTDNADVADGSEANLRFNELLGNCALTNSTLSGSREDEIRMTPASGTLTDFAISGTTIGPNENPGGNGITVSPTLTAATTLTVTNSNFQNIWATAIAVNGQDTTPRTVNVSTTTFKDNNTAYHQLGSFSADVTFSFTNNTLVRHGLNPIQIVSGSTSTNALQWNGTVSGNDIGDGSANSGAVDLHGIAVEHNGDVDAITSVLNNSVSNTDVEGFFFQSRLDADADAEVGRTDLALTDNTLGTPEDNSAFPFFAVYGTRMESRNTTILCLDIAGNNAGSVGGLEHFRVRQRDTSTFHLERLTDGDGTPNEVIATTAIIESHVAGQNDVGSTADETHVAGFTEAADGVCRTP
jgi:methionine-rich copper-binding protein CopC